MPINLLMNMDINGLAANLDENMVSKAQWAYPARNGLTSVENLNELTSDNKAQ